MTSTTDDAGLLAWRPSELVLSIRDRLDRGADRVAAKRFWDLWTVAIAGVVGLFLARPVTKMIQSTSQWNYILQHDGFHVFPSQIAPNSREANLTFRFMPRLVGGLLGFSSPIHYLVLQGIFGLILIWVVARLFDEALQDRSLAVVATVGTVGLWAVACTWTDFRGNFDGIALALLLLAMWTRRPPLVLLLGVAATFTDERAIFVLPLVAMWHLQREVADAADGDPAAAGLTRERWCALLAGAAMAGHVVLRLWFKQRYGLAEGQNRSPGNPWAQLNNYPNGIWGALEGFWLVTVAGVLTLVHTGRRWQAAVATASVLGTLVVGMSVFDISRSVAFVFPVVPLALLAMRRVDRDWVRGAVWIAVAITLVWPLLYAADDRTIVWVMPVPIQFIDWIKPS